MSSDYSPVPRQRAAGLPPPPAQRVSLPPDYQRAYELMGMAHDAAIPVAKLAGPAPKARGVSIASPVMVAVPMLVARPAPNARTEPIARPVTLAEPVAVAIAEPVATALPVSTPSVVAKPAPFVRSNFQTPKVAAEESKTLADPSSRLW